MGKKKSKRQPNSGDPPPPRPRKGSWVLYAVVGAVGLTWVIVLVSWLLGLI